MVSQGRRGGAGVTALFLVAALAFGAGYCLGRLRRVFCTRYTIDMRAALHEAGLVLMPKEALDELVDQAIAAEPEPPPEALH